MQIIHVAVAAPRDKERLLGEIIEKEKYSIYSR
jgi:hypothetical protein